MYALCKFAVKFGPKLIANPTLAVEMAPLILIAGAVALYSDTKK